jgi:hypothetical protein
VIAAWRIRTKNFKEDPEFYLIIRARNQILKDGSFASYASSSESSMEPGVVHYETAHYLDGETSRFGNRRACCVRLDGT